MRYPWAPDTPIRVELVAATLAATWAGGVSWSKRRADLLAGAIILVTVALLYAPSLRYGFLRDDFLFARPLPLSQLLSTFWGDWAFGYGTQYYRPIIAVSLALDYAVWGADPAGYHLINLAILAVAGFVGYLLLARSSGSAPAALVGVLVWLCHPMSVASAVWVNQRTDSVMAVFYLATLWLLLSPRFRPALAAAAVFTCALALGSKEMAVTLPALATVALFLFCPAPGRQRLRALAALAVVTVAYLGFWAMLFPEKLARTTPFDETQSRAGDFLPSLLVPIFFPVDYGTWLREWRAASMWPELALVAIALLLAGLGLRRSTTPGPTRLLVFAIAWVLLTPLPTLARPGAPDIYRLGFLVAFGSALFVCALAAALERRPLLRSALSGALALWLVPLANTSASAWSPGGFHYQQLMQWDDNPAFRQSLSPEMQRRFEQQLRRNVRPPR
jgi:hypothetical protein